MFTVITKIFSTKLGTRLTVMIIILTYNVKF